MSTHVLDVSGQRGLSVTMNDPARTGATVPAKAGDDVMVSVGNARQVRFELPPNVRIERREYVAQKQVIENGKPKRDPDGGLVFEDVPQQRLVLVIDGSLNSLFARVSTLPVEGEDPPTYENTPHTSMHVKKWTEPHFTESGTLIEEIDVREKLNLPWSLS